MDYALQSDMITRYGEQPLVELTDRNEPSEGVINTAVLQAALDDASSVIDTYIKRRYQLPLQTLPPALRQCCEAMAWFSLHRGRYTTEDRDAYDDAIKFMKDVSNGIALLEVAGAEPPSAAAQAVEQNSDRTFNKHKLKGF